MGEKLIQIKCQSGKCTIDPFSVETKKSNNDYVKFHATNTSATITIDASVFGEGSFEVEQGKPVSKNVLSGCPETEFKYQVKCNDCNIPPNEDPVIKVDP